jgi:hypothetical protein
VPSLPGPEITPGANIVGLGSPDCPTAELATAAITDNNKTEATELRIMLSLNFRHMIPRQNSLEHWTSARAEGKAMPRINFG